MKTKLIAEGESDKIGQLKYDTQDGGAVAGRTRKDIETQGCYAFSASPRATAFSS